MKKSKIIPFVLSFMFVFGFYRTALGGFEPGGCNNLPDPNSGPFLYGEFTLAVDKVCPPGSECAHYNLHLKLWREKGGNKVEEHLFSSSAPPMEGSICDLRSQYIIDYYGFYPCVMEVEVPFGRNYQGVPVIYELQITNKDFCKDPPNAMISGPVTIRVVPY